eukprot:gene24545-10153_t
MSQNIIVSMRLNEDIRNLTLARGTGERKQEGPGGQESVGKEEGQEEEEEDPVGRESAGKGEREEEEEEDPVGQESVGEEEEEAEDGVGQKSVGKGDGEEEVPVGEESVGNREDEEEDAVPDGDESLGEQDEEADGNVDGDGDEFKEESIAGDEELEAEEEVEEVAAADDDDDDAEVAASYNDEDGDGDGGLEAAGAGDDGGGYGQQLEESSMEGVEAAEAQQVTKRYLALLNAGKLASKKKKEVSDRAAAPKATNNKYKDTFLGSVFEQEIERLQASTSALSQSLMPLSRSRPGPLLPIGQSSYEGKGSPRAGKGASPKSPDAMHRTLADPRYSTSPMKKVLGPGPGAYKPTTNRFGRSDGTGVGFTQARQRPCQVYNEGVISPGPIYEPHITISSNCTSLPLISFPKKDLGTRFNPSASMPSNCPHWNPGPGDYQPGMVALGGRAEIGGDAPKWKFTKQQKGVAPDTNLSGTAFISKEHAASDNIGVHSPGPAAYHASNIASSGKPCAASHSIAPKAASYFDSYFDPARQTSPGPIYDHTKLIDKTGHKTFGHNPKAPFGNYFDRARQTSSDPIYDHTKLIDKTGHKTFGHHPKAPFGKADKMPSPEKNLSATGFITYEHSARANLNVDSPGPVYMPSIENKTARVKGTSMFSGQQDRFYSRFEPGRRQRYAVYTDPDIGIRSALGASMEVARAIRLVSKENVGGGQGSKLVPRQIRCMASSSPRAHGLRMRDNNLGAQNSDYVPFPGDDSLNASPTTSFARGQARPVQQGSASDPEVLLPPARGTGVWPSFFKKAPSWRRGTETQRIPSSYLTLIPLSDSRLKPRHTKLIVGSLLFLAVAAVAGVFLTVERGVTVGTIKVHSR